MPPLLSSQKPYLLKPSTNIGGRAEQREKRTSQDYSKTIQDDSISSNRRRNYNEPKKKPTTYVDGIPTAYMVENCQSSFFVIRYESEFSDVYNYIGL